MALHSHNSSEKANSRLCREEEEESFGQRLGQRWFDQNFDKKALPVVYRGIYHDCRGLRWPCMAPLPMVGGCPSTI